MSIVAENEWLYDTGYAVDLVWSYLSQLCNSGGDATVKYVDYIFIFMHIFSTFVIIKMFMRIGIVIACKILLS